MSKSNTILSRAMLSDDDYYKQVGIGGDAIVRVQNVLGACIKEHKNERTR